MRRAGELAQVAGAVSVKVDGCREQPTGPIGFSVPVTGELTGKVGGRPVVLGSRSQEGESQLAVLDLAGAAAYPAVEEFIAAAPGQGCWHNGTRCRVSTTDDLAAASVLITDARNFPSPDRRAGWERLSNLAAISRGWGDCYGYLLVATGRADVMVDPILNPWDAPPFLPIIEEAGGVFTGWNGRRDAFAGDAIATNRALADAARTVLWSADAPR